MATKLTKVRVGSVTYKIRYAKGEYDNSSKEGYCKPGEIAILADLTKGREAQTVLHEILHAVYDQQGLNVKYKDEEEFIVTCFANGISMLMRQNPKLMQYLQSLIDGD